MPTTDPTTDIFAPVTVAKSALKVDATKPTRLYELRVIDSADGKRCPKQTINIGKANATFSYFSGNPALGTDGELVGRLEYPRQRLTEEDVAEIQKYVANRVVMNPGKQNANVYERGHPSLKGQKDLRPLAEFLSLVPVSEDSIEEAKPVSMAG